MLLQLLFYKIIISNMTGRNYQMFALKSMPPVLLRAAFGDYSLEKVFKHDFWAATCLYKNAGKISTLAPGRIVVKFSRNHNFMGLPISQVGSWLTNREYLAYRQLAGVQGIPKLIGRISEYAFAIEFIENAKPLDHFETAPAGFFDKLRKIYEAVHNAGLAYVDANKRSNVLVTKQGDPILIDFQISALRPAKYNPFAFAQRGIIKYFQRKDIYHFLKHKIKMNPDDITDAERDEYKKPSGLHRLHRKIIRPYKKIRRQFLSKRQKKGLLISPTELLETHYQPEKQTWSENAQKVAQQISE